MEQGCLIVPCYNEEKRLNAEAFVKYIGSTKIPVSFCFVNDGSKDRALTIFNKLKKNQDGFMFAISKRIREKQKQRDMEFYICIIHVNLLGSVIGMQIFQLLYPR